MAVLTHHITRYELGDTAVEVGPFEMKVDRVEEKKVIFNVSAPTRWYRRVDGEWRQTADLEDQQMHNTEESTNP